VVSIAAIFLIGGCLEKTSDEVQEIDPRFVELPESVAESGEKGGGSILDEMEGDRVALSLEIVGMEGIPVDLDFRGEGGKNLGKWVFPGPAVIDKEIPAGLGELQIQAFQDLASDGPSDDDPFGWVDIVVGEEALTGLILEMEVGGKMKHAQSMGHVGVGLDEVEGPTVQLKMNVRSPANQTIDLDFRGDGGLVYKALLDGPGDHSISIPADLGKVQLQAFQDLASDGPSDDDPFAWLDLVVASVDPSPVVLVLEEGAKLDLAKSMGHGAVEQASQAQAFLDYDGDWTLLRGEISGGIDGPVQVDFRVPDPSEAGGNRFLGRTRLPMAGRYQLQVPRDMGSLVLEVFQDPGNDGPSDDDPYAVLELEIGDVDSLRAPVQLSVGTRGQPSATAGTSPDDVPSVAPQQSAFSDLGENPVGISGTLSLSGGGAALEFIDLDLFAPDASAPGGRRYIGKLKQQVGEYRFQVPQGFGPIEIEAFGDLEGDGPTPGDPFGRFEGNPVLVGEESISGVDIVLNPT